MTGTHETRHTSWRLRIAVFLVIAVAIVTVALTNNFLTDRYTNQTRQRAEIRLALYAGNILAELRKAQVIPQLLARDPALIGALSSGDYQQTTQRLIEYAEETGAASLTLLDSGGRVVAATDRALLGANRRQSPSAVAALRGSGTVFIPERSEAGPTGFAYARRLEVGRDLIGIIVVEVDLRQYETRWAGFSDAVFVMDSSGEIILSTEGLWRGRTEDEALAATDATSAIRRAAQSATEWSDLPFGKLFDSGAVVRSEARVPFQGWRIVAYTAYSSVRERVNGVLAVELTVFALIIAGLLWAAQRQATGRIRSLGRESAQLRELNARLSREIAERQRAEENLEAAEATLEQSSKLAALGEMSAAVSHELNQPLAAMKTYLAGAKLLVQRRRPEEALTSFQRIDDLIERMGAITRQLKSYARKGGEGFTPVDLRECISGALSMMEPQLRSRAAAIERDMPGEPVMVMGDRLRIEQVLVNLLRNALDATRGEDEPRIEILLAAGEEAVLTVRDNGPGIADLDALFEPFYTTKRPGDGVGLGLAISSGIVSDLKGRLTARNGRTGGAVFEVRLPILQDRMEAAE
ncbi:two-component system C4-dicarboxylate transport sensor histidine kinase DctB [Hasllibacter halocynthiae]|uniref:C4-dicarboxylate transport sensor protein DctB n=1 Tax=Hasllibacter halocynthiae TaxID=595589 RepID=A0A2T0X7T6_9RHOB|nr:ATP-binding protein [Hasllibacter halocynthiae]PRY94987.1 two-component system C4-dicarboxylate transport sensor histidine kinase DctB [Hasllibacter halocynthiae]